MATEEKIRKAVEQARLAYEFSPGSYTHTALQACLEAADEIARLNRECKTVPKEAIGMLAVTIQLILANYVLEDGEFTVSRDEASEIYRLIIAAAGREMAENA